jgi:hypothetical protein
LFILQLPAKYLRYVPPLRDIRENKTPLVSSGLARGIGKRASRVILQNVPNGLVVRPEGGIFA